MGAPTETRTQDSWSKSPLLYQLSYRGVTMLGHPALSWRFWEKVRVAASGCWEWTAAIIQTSGYGQFQSARPSTSVLTHRIAYEALVGAIPEGLTIDHLCRNKLCCNPDHLEPVTRGENSRRAIMQNRPTRCPHGHEYAPENTITKHRADGQVNRTCRTCTEARKAAKNARAREAYAARKAGAA